MTRTFTDAPAVRTAVPLLIGLVGPSGGGKTYSALRLATGIQRVTGGDIGVIDTESRRALHYADTFRFRHLEFEAPFGPDDYLAALEHFVSRGIKIVVVDSMSHEHEGPGGVLDWHDAEVERMSDGDSRRAQAVTMLCWAKPKAARRRLINGILRLGITMVACFRAKEKLQMVKGKEPIALGWQAISGDEFVYEMTANLLLPPGAKGVPMLLPEIAGEREMVKVPEQFLKMFAEPRQLDETIGMEMAEWARGTTPDHPLLARYRACADKTTFDALEADRRAVWAPLSAADKRALKAASDEAAERLREQPAVSEAKAEGVEAIPI